MSPRYADIIIDISHEAIDRTFQYRIPESLEGQIHVGSSVSIPFGRGNKLRQGYVVGVSDKASFDVTKMKDIQAVSDKGIAIEGSLIELAAYIKDTYGSTMINALKTVMPIKEKVKGLTRREVRLVLPKDEVMDKLALYQRKNAKAKYRLLNELKDELVIPYNLVTGKLNISSQTIASMVKENVIVLEEEGYYRDVFKNDSDAADENGLISGVKEHFEQPNEEQQAVISGIMNDYEKEDYGTYLLKGITGSGKTLVYIEIIDRIISMGRQAIVLIPEIALTYQTVKRFRKRFGDKVTIMNSRLSKGERYDQFERAKRGEVSVIIGPRSALFAPFPKLGLIVIDEEHETTYKSDYPPKYHAREVAVKRAQMSGASVILGSATPSVEAYYKAMIGEYRMFTLSKRAVDNAKLSEVKVVDMRDELKRGNRSIFSNHLKECISDRLAKGEQTMLFINRRGYAGFVSCRSCGYVFTCPHCDVSLTEHYPGTSREKLVCHYCGHEQKKPSVCPECGSKYIAGFGVGTEKVEEQVKKLFPDARVLRMDMDTTRKKDSHERILSDFANGKADILVGTQMIVKGHDFSDVTLVGVIAADTTLFDNDYRASEKTFDLLTQAAGRAGRGSKTGEVVIQTYRPEHYCIEAAAAQDYDKFYEDEKAYRSILMYPPFCHMMAVFVESGNEELTQELTDRLYERIMQSINENNQSEDEQQLNDGNVGSLRVIGPCEAGIYRLGDHYRRVIYAKHKDMQVLIGIKDDLERYMEMWDKETDCRVTFDIDPMKTY